MRSQGNKGRDIFLREKERKSISNHQRSDKISEKHVEAERQHREK
jgi:hypothetical protein